MHEPALPGGISMRNRRLPALRVRPLEDRLAPATFTVQNLNDAGADSLRDCIAKANLSPGADTIDFKSGLTGTITLTTGEIAVNEALTLTGPGSTKITLSGNNASRIFLITGAAAGSAINLSGLKLTAGKADFGGAIRGGDELLTLTDCVFTTNTATTHGGAVYINAGGSLAADNCAFTNNSAVNFAGALDVFGAGAKTILKTCTVSGNTGAIAGGLYAANYLLIESSTISGNTATTGRGGGLYAFGTFAAGALAIRNCTISGNSAKTDGAGLSLSSFTGTAVIQNSTFTLNSALGNGGAIARPSGTGTVALESSIVAQNSSGTGTADLFFSAATAVTANNCIIGVGDKGNATLSGTSLQKGTAASPLNAVLSTLGNFGGPTLTHHPLAGSPAIDKGANPAGLTNDQRGRPRAFNGTADVGALEVNPETYVVNLSSDENDGDQSIGDRSLREAMFLANASAASADVIQFDPAVFATAKTITLTLGEIVVAGPTAVNGPAAKVTVSGNNASRVFNLTAPAASTVSFADLSLINGKAFFGGALRTSGQVVSLSNCSLTGNTAAGGGGGAIAGYTGGGSVSLTDCTLSNNTAASGFGGAIDALGATTTKYLLTRCSVSGNSASTGGGLYINTYLLLDSCTVSGNSATGASATGLGGGVRIRGAFAAGALTVRNSTISGNSAQTDGGGIALDNFSGTLVLQNSTITANTATGQGGGVARASGTGNVQLHSTIVAQNSSAAGAPDFFFDAVTSVPVTNSIIGVADKGNINISGTGTATGTLASPFNAKLSVLSDNGGPMLTHRPLAGSPAIDAGANPAGLATDQRGFARVFGAAADVGAVEITPRTLFVDQPTDENDGNFAKLDLSLREALLLANEHTFTADTITFDDDPFNNDPFDFVNEIKLTLGQLSVTGPVDINWKLPFPLTVNAAGASRVLNVDGAPPGSAITLTGLRLTGGKVSGSGGAILAGDEVLTLNRCVITANQATTSFGGGVAMVGSGNLTLTDCVVSNNTASSSGGGICEIGGAGASVTLIRCDISGNTSFQGGGVYARNQFLMDGCTVSGNSCPSDTGGGIHLGQQTGTGTAVVRNSTISGNLGEFGGGIATIYSFKGTLQVQNCTIVNNQAVESGGGLFRGGNFAVFDIVSSIVAGNSAKDGSNDIRHEGLVNVNFSAIGQSKGFTLSGANNLPFGTDLKLGPLQFNGGPTPTHALLAGSPAVDKGVNPSALVSDQRGGAYKRSVGAAPDIGAYETAKVFLVTNSNDSGPGSLRQAASDADDSAAAGLVRFDPALFSTPQTITLTSGTFGISLFYNVEIQGPGANLLTISGNNSSRLFFAGGTFTPGEAIFSGLTLTAGKSSHGGAISSVGQSVIIRDSVISGNTATVGGGAMSLNTSRLRMERCTVVNNSAVDYGGGLYFFSRGSFVISESTISGNSVTNGQGGGLYFFNATYAPAVLRNSTVSGNTAKFEGGGIALNFRGNLLVQNSTITKNTSADEGGGIGRFGGQGDVTLQSSIVAQNTSTAGGPDIHFQLVLGTVFADNSIIGVANAGNLTITGAGNQTGTLVTPLDAKLSTLQDFGGPTRTHLPLVGSPAIDKGSNVARLAVDQRGLARVFGAAADVGAVETHPAVFVVDLAIDENDGNFAPGDLSLREALVLANASPATADTITFDPAVFGSPAVTTTLSLGELAIAGPVAVVGPGADVLTISGSNASRIFNLTTAAAATDILIAGLKLAAGKASNGGAIVGSDERLSLTDCVLTGNAATNNGGAVFIAGGGSLTATRCTFSNNTAANFIGGIDVFGTGARTILRSCTVSNNSSPFGGGLYASNYLLVENSTISGNKATISASGGLYLAGTFAAGALTIRNSTISGNSAATLGGGVFLAGFVGTLDLQNSTITNNSVGSGGGGIARNSGTGSVTLTSSIVAQNTGGTGAADLSFNTATAVTANNSIIGVQDKGNFAVGGAGNLTGTAASPLNAKLGPLAANGGLTQTHLPQPGSPAIDNGANTLPLTFDQRGALRSAGAGTDIGAVEVQSALHLVVDIIIDESDGTVAKGDLSLREALEIASGSVESVDTITFDPAVFGSKQTIILTAGEIAIAGPVLVQGPGSGLLTLSGNNASRIFNTGPAPQGTQVTLTDLTFTAGSTARRGGAIVAINEKLQLANCVFTGNAVTGGSFSSGGGAVAVYSLAALEATDCTFTANSAAKAGGGAILALRVNAQTLTLRRCTVSGNTALFGGGVYSGRELLLEDSTVSGNAAPAGNSGGIFLYAYDSSGATVGTIRNSTISGNSAALVAGGIGLGPNAATLLIQNSTVVNNSVAGGQGGGIFNAIGATTITLHSSIVAGNAAGTGPDVFSPGPVNAVTSFLGSAAGITTFNPDLTTTALLGKNPLLGPLAANGGPTLTHALLPGSPAIDAGSNPAALANDQRGSGFARVAGAAADIGAFEVQNVATPPTALVQVNDGSAQRSRVTSFQVTFSETVTFPSGLAAAFQLQRTGPGGPTGTVTLAFNQVANVITITFNDATFAPTGGSLIDGLYTLTLVASKIQGAGGSFDGDGNGVGGDNQTLLTHRLFGDNDGDRDVDAQDFGAFRAAFGGTSNLAFDFDGDGDVDAQDFGQFRSRFGSSL